MKTIAHFVVAASVSCLLPAAAWAQAAAPARQAAALPGESLAANMGCLNCHGAAPRGDAPSFARMRERAGSGEREPAAVARHWVEEMRGTATGWRAIVGHRQVTDETARALTDWLTSAPSSRPVN